MGTAETSRRPEKLVLLMIRTELDYVLGNRIRNSSLTHVVKDGWCS